MSSQHAARIIEGLWEDIVACQGDFAGRRVRVVVLHDAAVAPNVKQINAARASGKNDNMSIPTPDERNRMSYYD